MISVIRYEGAGINQRASRIVYDIAKGLVAQRLQEAIEDGEDHMTPDDLGKVDAGTLPESRLLRLFTRDEIKAAMKRRLGELGDERKKLKEMMERLPGRSSGVSGGAGRAMYGGSEQE